MEIVSKEMDTLLIRKYIRFLIEDTFQSHTFEPAVGDQVQNTNKNCKHFGSEGVVVSIDDLPSESGKTITYKVANDGDSYYSGMELTKTLDQLAPLFDMPK